MFEYPLNKAQKQAIEYTKGPLLIVAGAGTGKTTVITNKIAYLIEQGLAKPDEILALAFNDKAAQEIEERVDKLVNTSYSEITISTFHVFCQRILESHGIDIGLSNQFKVLSQTAAWILIRENFDKFNLDYYRPMGNPTKHIHDLLRHFSKCKDELISPEEYLAYAEDESKNKDVARIEEKSRLTEIANAYHTYNQLLLDTNHFDFGDLLYYPNKLFEKRSNILKKYQNKYKYILVDEFQDVNWAQYNLVRLLTGVTVALPPYQGGVRGCLPSTVSNFKGRLTPPSLPLERGGNLPILTVVGDDDQSIYAFRGASVSNIMRFKDDYLNTKKIILNENYRSEQAILDVAYKSIQNNNPDRLEVKLNINKKLISKSKSQLLTTGYPLPSVTHIHEATLEKEVEAVISEIFRLKQIDTTATWDDFAILVRANSHADPFIARLQSTGIPYEFLAASGLFRQTVVVDSLNFFNLLTDHQNGNAIFRLLRLPFLGFTENNLQKFTFGAKKKAYTYYEALKKASEFGLSESALNACDTVLAVVDDGLKNSRELKPTVLLYKFLETSGYLNYLKEEEELGNRELIRQSYQLKEFFDYLQNYEAITPDAHVVNFMQEFANIENAGDTGSLNNFSDTPDSVNVMTVHKSKGLEYKYVFVVNLVEDRFPTRTKGDGIEIPLALIKEQLPEGDSHYEEERRLFYVAMTRAKSRLYFTSAADYGGARVKKLSRFLAEIGYSAEADALVKPEVTKKYSPEKEIDQHIVYELPKSFSFSHILMYETCPYKYKLSHVLSLPSKGSHYFSFGSSIHNSLQAFYDRVQALNAEEQSSLFAKPKAAKTNKIAVPTIDELLKIYESKWLGDWYQSSKQKTDFFEKGKKVLRTFYKSQEGNWTIPLFLESFFKIKIGDHLLSGRIDRVDSIPEGGLEIIDYKTGKSKKTLTAADKSQLLIYQIAAEQLPEYRNVGTPKKLTYYYLEDEIKSSFIGSSNDTEKLKLSIVEIIEKIKSQEFAATPNQFACEHCDFRSICEFRV